MDYVKLIENINQELYGLIPDEDCYQALMLLLEEYPLLSFESIGYAHNILFLNIPIWCSENDERPYENEDDPVLCDHISLEKWLWQEIKRILSLLNGMNKLLKNKE